MIQKPPAESASQEWARTLANALPAPEVPPETPPDPGPAFVPPDQVGTSDGAPPADDSAWANDVGAAVGSEYIPPGGEVPPQEAAGAPSSSPEAGTPIPPEFVRGVIKQAAGLLCVLQVWAQSWVEESVFGIKDPGTVDMSNPGIVVGREIWEAWLLTVMPPELPIPPWLIAPLVIAAATVPVQIMGAGRKRRPEDPPAE